MIPKKILIVDDEIIIARELEARLTLLGYEVTGIASSGREAIALIEETEPDLVLMDIVIKGDLDGIETAAKIRRRWSIPVIYLTAYTDDTTLQRARITEPFGYIVKPFSERELRANIEMALYKHEAEIKQRNIENWFAASMRGIADGVIATDRETLVTFLNPVAEWVTGWGAREAIGRQAKEVFQMLSANDYEQLIDPISTTLTSGIVTDISGNVFLLNRKAEKIPIDYSAACLRDESRNPTGVVIVFRDLSERQRTEGLLRDTQEQLIQAQKMEAIGRLAGGIAHDFNNLLTAIIGYSQLVMDQLQDNDPIYLKIAEVEKAGKRAAELTGQLLAFSRKQVLQPKVINLNAVIDDIEKMLRRLIGEDIDFSVIPDPQLDSVKADPRQMEQIIMNLAVNARDAMPQGGKLTIETANIHLDETYASDHVTIKPGPYVLLAVSDTGIGMDKETQSRIFEPFYTTKEFGKGTGLGLSTVYGIVKQSGGNIWIYSELNQGTTFKVYLPSINQKLEINDAQQAASTPHGGSETLLLIEDEEAVRTLARQILEMNGYTVIEASNGIEAINLCQIHQDAIEMVITDVVLPGLSGSDLVEQLRAMGYDKKILYMSGYTDRTIVSHGILEPNIAFLEKPFTPASLSKKVRELLDEEAIEE
ncbi:MAG: response regulator [Acidobacteriota bacterium]